MTTVKVINTRYNPRGASVVVEAKFDRWTSYLEVSHDQPCGYNYRRMRHETDPLADWVRLETAERDITAEGVRLAKDAIIVADNSMEEACRWFKYSQLYETMQAVVTETVKNYQDDFYLHDCTRLGMAHPFPEVLRWYVRESGTFLFFGEEVGEWECAVRKQWPDARIFRYTSEDGLAEISSH